MWGTLPPSSKCPAGLPFCFPKKAEKGIESSVHPKLNKAQPQAGGSGSSSLLVQLDYVYPEFTVKQSNQMESNILFRARRDAGITYWNVFSNVTISECCVINEAKQSRPGSCGWHTPVQRQTRPSWASHLIFLWCSPIREDVKGAVCLFPRTRVLCPKVGFIMKRHCSYRAIQGLCFSTLASDLLHTC